MTTKSQIGLRRLIVDWPTMLDEWAGALVSEGTPSPCERWLAARVMCGAADHLRNKKKGVCLTCGGSRTYWNGLLSEWRPCIDCEGEASDVSR